MKPLLARSGPLDDIDVALRLIYALGKMEKWLYADITHFSQFYQYLKEQDTLLASPMTSHGILSATLIASPVTRHYSARWSR